MRNFWTIPLPVVCVAAVLGLGWGLQRAGAQADLLTGTEIDKLIAQLGSDPFEVREAATQKLKQHEEAIPALQQALKSSDGEVARRAAVILDFFALQEKKRAFAKLAALGKAGRVDQAVEKLVRRKEWDDEDACWQVLAELAGRLTDLEQKQFGKVSLQPAAEVPARDFRRYRENMRPHFRAGSHLSPRDLMDTRFVVRAVQLQTDVHKIASLLAAASRAKTPILDRSVLFAGDSVEVANVDNSLIVCDGEVTAQGCITNSLIIARGDIHCFDLVENSRIITAGSLRLDGFGKLTGTKVKEKEAKPLDFVTFFDPAQVGIKVEKADSGLRVKEAAKDKLFARAGLRADDLVVAVDGDTVKDPEVFRRLLRAKLAVDGEMALKVRRGEQTLELHVLCKD
jgi:hypothetical protein